ncbi:hypothetical protein [Corynebacterium timonense]|uniref:Uncharacterized protein n=1 Tax=Corynebacterium timonense TaxID=441500 RepID=A0A1H1MQ91_9CORY|nr:hypothetical protein [Corynebacterium timonense]SDR88535.1 hypothetical protein SAMN04488539_0577 [Corynebacterium timonense]
MKGAVLAAVTAGVIAVAGLVALGESVQVAPVPAGDQLGAEAGESWEAYAQRAAESLAQAPAEEPVFALVTFLPGAGPAEAAAELEGIGRVNAAVFAGKAAQPVPEPTGGDGRAEVFTRAAERAGVDPGSLLGVVIYAPGGQLREVAGRAGVAAVEALPPDAVWGAFAIVPTPAS